MQKKTVKKTKPTNETKTLDQLKKNIEEKVGNIEKTFFSVARDLFRVKMIVGRKFKKWLQENTSLDASLCYGLVKLAEKDGELSDSKNYRSIKGKISLYKLLKVVRYPTEFIEKLDFTKKHDLPGNKKANLLEMPRSFFAEVLEHEFKMMKANEKGIEVEPGLPTDEMVIKASKDKLDKLLRELKNVFTMLSEIRIKSKSKGTIDNALTEIKEITENTDKINSVATKLLASLKKQARLAKAA